MHGDGLPLKKFLSRGMTWSNLYIRKMTVLLMKRIIVCSRLAVKTAFRKLLFEQFR